MAMRQFEVPMNFAPSPSCIACTHQSCHRKECRRRVPKSAIRSPSMALAQPFDLFPKPRHGAGIKHLQLELAHALQHGARAIPSARPAPESPTA
jgi:hypothetical protein